MTVSFRKIPIITFADTVGDGTGDIDAIGDYSVTPGTLKIIPPPSLVYVYPRFSVIIADAGNMDSGGYGNNGANPLTNGVEFEIIRDGVTLLSFTGNNPIKTNTDWLYYMDSLDIHNFGTGDQVLVSTLDMTSLEWPHFFDGRAGDEWHIKFNDDLTHLTRHRFISSGYMIPVEFFDAAPYV